MALVAESPEPTVPICPGAAFVRAARQSIRSGQRRRIRGQDFALAAAPRPRGGRPQRPDDAEALNNLRLALERSRQEGEAVDPLRACGPDLGAGGGRRPASILVASSAILDNRIARYTEYATPRGCFPNRLPERQVRPCDGAPRNASNDRRPSPNSRRPSRSHPAEPSFRLSLGISLEQVGRITDAFALPRRASRWPRRRAEAAQLKARLDAVANALASLRSLQCVTT